MQLRGSSPPVGFFLEKAGHEMGTEFLSILRRQRGALRGGGSERSAAVARAARREWEADLDRGG